MQVKLCVAAILLPLVFSCAAAAQVSAGFSRIINSTASADGSTDDHDVRMATDGRGTWVAVWASTYDLNGSGTDADIFVARSTDDGASWGQTQLLNSTALDDNATFGRDLHPEIACDGDTWVVVWDSTYALSGADTADEDIFYALSTDAGRNWSTAKFLNSYAESDANDTDRNPAIAQDKAGRWMVAWEANHNFGSSGTDFDIVFSKSVDAGVNWSAALLANDSSIFDGTLDADTKPAIAAFQNTFLIAWETSTNLDFNSGTDIDIAFVRSINGGDTWTSTFYLNSYHTEAARTDEDVSIATDGSGNWVAVWASDYNIATNGNDGDIMRAVSNNNGLSWNTANILSSAFQTDTGSEDKQPYIACDGGGWAVAWASENELGATIGRDFDILGSTSFSVGATWSAPAILNIDAAADGNAVDDAPIVATNNKGRWITAWSSNANPGGVAGSDYELLSARFSTNGSPMDVTLSTAATGSVQGAIAVRAELNALTELFDASDVEVVNGYVSGFTGPSETDGSYYFVVVPQTAGTFTTRVPSGAFPSIFGSDNTASNVISATYSPPDAGTIVAAPASAVNSTATFDIQPDTQHQVAMDSGGHAVAVWRSAYDLNGAGTDGDIFLSRSPDSGASWTTAALMADNATTDGTSEDSSAFVATDDFGTWIAAWRSNNDFGGTAGNDNDIVFARSFDEGRTWEPVALLNSNALTDGSTINDDKPSLAGDGQGNWVAVWQSNFDPGDNFGGDVEIYVAISSDNGATWSAQEPLNSEYSLDALADTNPQVATDKVGNWIVVWQGPGLIDTNDIYYAKSTDNGATWTAQAQAVATVSHESEPQVATDSHGNWVIVCESDDGLDGDATADFEIYVTHSSDSGDTWSTAALLNSSAGSDDDAGQFAPQISTDGKGTWVCLWQSTFDPGGTSGDSDLFVSYSTDKGETWTSEARLNAEAASDTATDNTVQLETDQQGNWLAVWQSDNSLGDMIGNDGDLLFSRFLLKDTTAPGITLNTASPALVNAPVSVSVSLTEDLTNFDASALSLSNATVTGFSGANNSFSFTLVPSSDGAFSVEVAAGAFSDAAGNPNSASNTLSFTYDSTAPAATLTTVTPSPTNGSIDVVVQLSEDSGDFDSSDLQIGNATISSFAGSGDAYSIRLIAIADGPVSVVVPSGAFSDGAGNFNAAASNTISITFDSTPPTVTLDTTAPDPANSPIVVTVAISEPVTTFDETDIVPTNATVSDFSGSGDSYSFTLAPLAESTFGAEVPAGGVADAAGNGSAASNTITRSYVSVASCVLACAGEPTPVDNDSDGLSECVEACFGTSDAAIDTDADGMPDPFETQYGLDNTLDDAALDPDDDAYTNLEEFLMGSDPTDSFSPDPTFYVSVEGDDQPSGGTAGSPWASIAYALQQTNGTPGARIVLREGIYTEDFTLPPGGSVSGTLSGGAVVRGHIIGSEGGGITHLEVLATGNPGVLLTINNVVMEVRDVQFSGGKLSQDRGILVIGLDSADSLIELCDFRDLYIGIDIEDNIPLIRRCTFGELYAAGINIQDGEFDSRDKSLGDSTDATTGFNTFYRTFEQSKAIINLRSTGLRIENNDWNTDNMEEAQAAVLGGSVGGSLPGGSAIFAASLFCTVWDMATQARVTTASVSLSPGGFSSITKNVDGVYAYPAVLGGNYNLTVNAPEYESGSTPLSVAGGGIISVLMALQKTGTPTEHPQSADLNDNGIIEFNEVLRVIQLYNAQTFHCGGGEDGFALGPGTQNCDGHALDYNPKNWSLSLGELLRLLQFFNNGGYHDCNGTEDGFCPGP